MLKSAEKAYCLALQALKRREYRTAVDHFDQAAPGFENNSEFDLLREATRLLVAVQKEMHGPDEADSSLEIEEVFSNG